MLQASSGSRPSLRASATSSSLSAPGLTKNSAGLTGHVGEHLHPASRGKVERDPIKRHRHVGQRLADLKPLNHAALRVDRIDLPTLGQMRPHRLVRVLTPISRGAENRYGLSSSAMLNLPASHTRSSEVW